MRVGEDYERQRDADTNHWDGAYVVVFALVCVAFVVLSFFEHATEHRTLEAIEQAPGDAAASFIALFWIFLIMGSMTLVSAFRDAWAGQWKRPMPIGFVLYTATWWALSVSAHTVVIIAPVASAVLALLAFMVVRRALSNDKPGPNG